MRVFDFSIFLFLTGHQSGTDVLLASIPPQCCPEAQYKSWSSAQAFPKQSLRQLAVLVNLQCTRELEMGISRFGQGSPIKPSRCFYAHDYVVQLYLAAFLFRGFWRVGHSILLRCRAMNLLILHCNKMRNFTVSQAFRQF